MRGAGAVTALVLLEASAGVVALGAWTQSWSVVRRGHFRIVAWSALGLGALALAALGSGLEDAGAVRALWWAALGGAALYLLAQYVRSDVPATVVGYGTGAIGVAALTGAAARVPGWPAALAGAHVVAGAALLGTVTTGMLLGHWYLNQPGLKPWALARLTTSGLGAAGASALLGLVATSRLAGAETPGAVLGIPGFGESFGTMFFVVWVLVVGFTTVVVALARRCVAIRSIQSATGLMYVALLTAGVAELLVRYLMLNTPPGSGAT
jgi:hypothetical protein